MAKILKTDELNILEFFGAMNLPEAEIEKRIVLAESLKNAYYEAFLEIKKQRKQDDEYDEEYIEDMLQKAYETILDGQNIRINDFIQNQINKTINEVLEVTDKNPSTDYYTSPARAAIIAVNDVNAIGNYELAEQAIKEGKTTKRWDTMKDERVRHNHVMADGLEVDIDKPFEVGTSKLMFPCDTSMGASAEEIVNCRCVCIYS